MVELIGNKYEDNRGIISYNNDFDATPIKRIYTIENYSTDFIRGWQGHQIEQRWFSCMKGEFEIYVIEIDDFENPSTQLQPKKFVISDQALSYLHVPAGCITAIKSKTEGAKLLVLADYAMGEINDEYRFPIDYFTL